MVKTKAPLKPQAKFIEKVKNVLPINKNSITASTCMKCGKGNQELNTSMNWCTACQKWCISCGKKVATFGNGKNLQHCVDCRFIDEVALAPKKSLFS